MHSIFVTVESTPNPNTRKFSFGEYLTREPFELSAPFADTTNPVSSLFAPEVQSVFVGNDYFAVTVTDVAAWPETQKAVKTAIAENAVALRSIGKEIEQLNDNADDPVVTTIREILDTKIRPAVAHDGGDVRFKSFKDGVVTLEMAGACSGCPSSTATLKLGILNMLRYFVPEVRDVVAAAD